MGSDHAAESPKSCSEIASSPPEGSSCRAPRFRVATAGPGSFDKHCRAAAVWLHIDALHGNNKQVLPMTCEVDHAQGKERSARRLGNLIRRLSSEHDGELVAVVHAIRRTLASAGHTLHDLADVIEAASAHADDDQHAAREQWRRDVRALLRRQDELTEWELRFVRNVSRYRNPPSAKQLDVLACIWLRLHEEAADAA